MANSKVLIVEDEPSIAESLTFLIERAGFEAFHARDGQLALTATQSAKVDLIILDLMLPRLAGLEVLRLVRSQALNQDTPVLVLTARGQAQDEEKAIANGATAFMTKPFSNKELVATATRLIEAE